MNLTQASYVPWNDNDLSLSTYWYKIKKTLLVVVLKKTGFWCFLDFRANPGLTWSVSQRTPPGRSSSSPTPCTIAWTQTWTQNMELINFKRRHNKHKTRKLKFVMLLQLWHYERPDHSTSTRGFIRFGYVNPLMHWRFKDPCLMCCERE